jgi:hypothetical protein
MKCPRWVIWNVLTALSFLACLATLALWVRSARTLDTVHANWSHLPQQYASVFSIQGRLVLDTPYIHWRGEADAGIKYEAQSLDPGENWSGYVCPPGCRSWLGFVWQDYDPAATEGRSNFTRYPYHVIIVPHWFLAGVFAVLPLVWVAGVRRRVGLLDLMALVATIAVLLGLGMGLLGWLGGWQR